MYPLTFLTVVLILGASVRAAPLTSAAECLERTADDVIAFQHTLLSMTINGEIRRRGLVAHRDPLVDLVEEIFKDVTDASREMLKSTTVKDLAFRKGSVMKTLDSKAPGWGSRMEGILQHLPIDDRKAKASEMTDSVLSLARTRLLSGIETSGRFCF